MSEYIKYIVKKGDCVSKVAMEHGLFWEKLWEYQKQFKGEKGCIYYDKNNKKRDPNLIYPKEIIFIPKKEKKEEAKSDEEKHTFRAKGVPAKLRLRLIDGDKPLANIDYSLDIDGKLLIDTTDEDGYLERSIPPDAKGGKLIFEIENETTKQKEKHEFRLQLGSLDPIDTVDGVQARLRNLGFYLGKINGKFDLRTIRAIRSFQRKHELEDTKEIKIEEGSTRICLDSDTSDQLVESHGS